MLASGTYTRTIRCPSSAARSIYIGQSFGGGANFIIIIFFYKIMLMIRCFTYVKYIYIYISCKYIIHLFESLISVIRFDSENKVWQRPPYRIWSRTRTELRETTTRFFFGIAPRNDKRGMNWWIEGQCKKAKATTNVLRIPLSACIAR